MLKVLYLLYLCAVCIWLNIGLYLLLSSRLSNCCRLLRQTCSSNWLVASWENMGLLLL